MAVNVEFDQDIAEEQAREVLSEAEDSRVLVYNRRKDSEYITKIDIVQENAVCVSHIRRDNTTGYGLNTWIVADNLSKGAVFSIFLYKKPNLIKIVIEKNM